MASSSYDYDLIVIGSGAGGSIAAQHVAKAGKRVAVVESGNFGGTEVTNGRIPLNTLLEVAHNYQTIKHGDKRGIRGATVGYNYPILKAWKESVVKNTGVHTTLESLSALGINATKGRAFFIDPHTISIGSARLSSREFLIATGSEAVLPDVVGLASAGFLTPREALEFSRPPKKITIIGSGQLACEFAQLFAIFGTKVYMVESAPRVLHTEEPEASEYIERVLRSAHGVELLLGSTIEKVESLRGSKKITVKHAGQRRTLITDEVLVATDKKAATDIGLENAGVQYQDGAIYTDAHMQTTASHVYAAGSCTGSQNNTHVAAYQSQVAAHNLLHNKKLSVNYQATPRAVFTAPQVAAVGATEAELKGQKADYKRVVVPLSVVAKSSFALSGGFVKVLASTKSDAILGATIVGPDASEMIHELTLAIQNYVTTRGVAHTVHVFPTWSEAIRIACAKLAKV